MADRPEPVTPAEPRRRVDAAPTAQLLDLRRAALAEVDTYVELLASDAAQLHLLRRAVDRLLAQVASDTYFPPLDLPLLTFRLLTGAAGRAAVQLAAVCAFVFLGADTLDDVADGDARPEWRDIPPTLVSLAGSTILATLPAAVLVDLPSPERTRLALLRVLGAGLVSMSAGQQMDLAHRLGPPPSAGQVERSVVGKSGAEMAMFAEMAATLAHCDARHRTACAEMGRALGTAMQFAADLGDLVADTSAQRDLRDGAWTLPLVWHLERLHGTARADFVDLCVAATADAASRQVVRDQVLAGGTARMCAVVVEAQCQRGLRALRSLTPHDVAAADELAAMVSAPSPLHRNAARVA